jgi:hypothetical protein
MNWEKFEARNPKVERNPKREARNDNNKRFALDRALLISDFETRMSN